MIHAVVTACRGRQAKVILSVIVYSFSAGLLLLLNKLVLHHWPYPSLLLSLQMIATLIFLFLVKASGYVSIDPIQSKQLLPFVKYSLLVCLAIYSNIATLAVTQMETVLVLRALTPCLVAVLDHFFLGREYPNRQSWLGLACIVVGAYGYAYVQQSFRPVNNAQQLPVSQQSSLSTFSLGAVFWSLIYLVAMSGEMAYGRRMVKLVDWKTRSAPVLYTNLLCFAPLLLFAAMHREYQQIASDRETGKLHVNVAVLFVFLLACLAAIATSYATWWCREKVSATSFTVIGVVTMCVTMPLNVQEYYVYWQQQHQNQPPLPPTPAGLLCIVLCLVGGIGLYRQAPVRVVSYSTSRLVAAEADDIWKLDTSFYEEVEHFNSMDEASTASLQDYTHKRRPVT